MITKTFCDGKTEITEYIVKKALQSEEFSQFKDSAHVKGAKTRSQKIKAVAISPQNASDIPTTTTVNNIEIDSNTSSQEIPMAATTTGKSIPHPTTEERKEESKSYYKNQDIAAQATAQRVRWVVALLDEFTGMDESERTGFKKSLPKGKISNMELAEKSKDRILMICKQMSDNHVSVFLGLIQELQHIIPVVETMLYDEMERRKKQNILTK